MQRGAEEDALVHCDAVVDMPEENGAGDEDELSNTNVDEIKLSQEHDKTPEQTYTLVMIPSLHDHSKCGPLSLC